MVHETTQRARRKGALWLLAGLLAFAVILAGLNVTGAPLRVARQIARTVEEETGWQVDVRGAHFTALGQLRLTEVGVLNPEHGIYGRLPVVDVSLDPWGLVLRRTKTSAVEGVRLLRPRFVHRTAGEETLRSAPLPAGLSPADGPRATEAPLKIWIEVVDGTFEQETPEGDIARAFKVEGKADLQAGKERRVSVRELRVREVGEPTEAVLRRQGEGDAYAFEVKGAAEAFLPLLGFDRWRVSGLLSASGELEFAGGLPLPGNLRRGTLAAEVTHGDIIWGEQRHERAAFDKLSLAAEGDGRAWSLSSLTLQRGAAVVTASGEIALPGEGGEGELNLSVAAEGFQLPKDLPVLARFGLSGAGAFRGNLSGAPNHPVLSGRLSLSRGTVWHRPIARGEGSITLSSDRFGFSGVKLWQGTASYLLDGEIRWDRDPQHISLALQTDRGSVRELLRAFSVEVDAEGEFDGTLHLQGPAGAIRLWGDAAVRAAQVGGVRYFDEAVGRFAWSGGVLTLSDVEVRHGGGVARVDGSLQADRFDVAVSLAGWPVEAGSGPLASLEPVVSGWVNYEGRLEGSLEAPKLWGRFLGGELALGRLRAVSPVGEAAVTPDVLELHGVSLTSAGEGRYVLSGAVSGWRTKEARVDLDVQVEGASLSGLLREMGMNLPALLIDGEVNGTVKVAGPVRRPDARLNLALGDGLGVGEPIRLEFGFEDGKLKLSRNALLSLIRGSWS